MNRQNKYFPDLLGLRSKTLLFAFITHVLLLSSLVYGQNTDLIPAHKHQTTSESCFLCDPALREKGRLWCKEHNRYEDRCWKCHPEIKDESRAYCSQHYLYEDECFLCHRELKQETSANNGHSVSHKCTRHGIQQERCYLCDSALREKGRLWCKEHDRYEDRCWKCHPEIEDESRAFCTEHYLYEDECFFCDPELKKKTDQPGGEKKAVQPALQCNEHRVLERECGICQPQLASTLEAGKSLKVRFESSMSATKAGVLTRLPNQTTSTPRIDSFCQLGYNENAVALITPIVAGIVQRVRVDMGSQVRAGDILVEIHSIEISKAKTEFLSAIADHRQKEMAYKREKKLVHRKISAEREYEEAFASLEKALFAKNTAYQKLLNYGFSDISIGEISDKKDRSSTLRVKAPFSGTIVSRQAVIGETVAPGKPLFTIVDLSTMWLELNIPADEMALVEPGQAVEATFQSLPGYTAIGNLVWVDTSIDPSSRMLRARAVVENNGKLKKGMFGRAQISINQSYQAYQVPTEAIQRHENNTFVFIKVEDDLYDLRRVTLGNRNGTIVDVIAGIGSDEQIVVAGTFTVMSEFLKSRLGAGCVD